MTTHTIDLAAYAALEAERDALAARLAAVEAALAPALEAEQGATPGEWQAEYAASWTRGKREIVEWFVRLDGDDVAIAADILDPRNDDQPSETNARLIAAAVNAVRAVKALKEAD